MRRVVYFLLLLISASSCLSKKELVYMQNENLKETAATSMQTSYKPYQLQPADVLSIKVQSLEPEISNIYNIVPPSSAFGFADPGTMFLSGYSVDDEGNVNLPNVGKVKVSGLTLQQTQELIQRNVDRYITNATVVVKLINFRVSVLGEVNRPGQYFVYNERATLFDALGMAGDLTRGAARENVKLVRQTPGGSEVVLLDLKDPNIVQSRYYFMQPNDVLYVEPSVAQVKRDNLVSLNVVTIALGVISTAAVILNYFK
ncbi:MULTISPECIES: polysaccharide biosynthesis/export family protein [Pontibacter]|uniref:Protein involved in gliding motility EpsA n=1 Tax=Pontibacter lucknowensis TaxID=1077936 RepID=A0A1N6ZFD0_9BACT|nr:MULTISPECIES: polysaccharide biosynthesis/export family protein [Pontibacter]EJF09386.1 polysaccharide export protein [Pontibacter sp. BAB1700]SIR25508.1 protein involved in gliding motility EpsA [Pontibacter lucknowensis]